MDQPRQRASALCVAIFSLCLAIPARAADPLRIAATAGLMADIIQFAADRARQQGLALSLTESSDWNTPNARIAEVLRLEAPPGLIAGFAVTLVTPIGASVMAGALGAGGLGDRAIRYGYQRFRTDVMVEVVIVLIALVSVFQFAGDCLSRHFDHR